MIPLRLALSGFLSYREAAEIDFTPFHLACISGSNGAGKSSLLDAMTWALFGKARKQDETLINRQSDVAKVAFTFEYEGNRYRVLRSLARGKTTVLEFQMLDATAPGDGENEGEGRWKPLTERTMRETEKRIEEVLRLDYETFINVSFFLQGRADEFARQPASKRKDILSSILGLEMWETFRARAVEKRKDCENDLNRVAGSIAEIDAELAEEDSRKKNLQELEENLHRLQENRRIQEQALEGIRQMHAAIDRQRLLVKNLESKLMRSRDDLARHQTRLLEKEAERQPHTERMGREQQITAAYNRWQEQRRALEGWEGAAAAFHEQEQRRDPFVLVIEAEKGKLEQEKSTLEAEAAPMEQKRQEAQELTASLGQVRASLAEVENRLDECAVLEQQVKESGERQSALVAENKGLKTAMDELEERIKRLKQAEGAVCPLCGQPLSPEHRLSTLKHLEAEGKEKGDAWRANKSETETIQRSLAEAQTRLKACKEMGEEKLSLASTLAQLTERLEMDQKLIQEWDEEKTRRLKQVQKELEGKKYAPEARRALAKVDKELAALGYDAPAHHAARQAELEGRTAEEEYRLLEAARSALKPLEDEIADLGGRISRLQEESAASEREYQSAVDSLGKAEAQAPILEEAEQSAQALLLQENRLNQEVGAARQKVLVLDVQRQRRKKLDEESQALRMKIGQFKTLERAFGKDGVPALLIEQALPQIEEKANQILGRLSDDSMHLNFETQSKYKDEKRKDLRETLEITVSDGTGRGDYENFSGGEAFRINFAIRLALSEVLAQRKGARLQMLVIDEGFGSQDAEGRQRLIQAINAIKADFARILVITHLEELKDAFPQRIEVEKSDHGSVVQVV